MTQADVIKEIYQENTSGRKFPYAENEGEHMVTIELNRFTVDREKMRFSSDNFPYIRAALLDKHLEVTDAEIEPF